MDRLVSRCAYLLAVLTVALAIAPVAGCTSALTGIMYLVRGTDVDPAFKGLQQKKVAVVCRPLVALQYRNSSVAKDLAREVASLLSTRVRKVKMIDAQKVEEWLDENSDSEPVKLGKALKAEMVVAIDLEQFSLYQGQTIYQGKANVALKVYDCKENHVVFQKTLPRVSYPPNTGIPASDRPEAEFRRAFVRVLADQIGRHFYAHDPHADLGLDVDAI